MACFTTPHAHRLTKCATSTALPLERTNQPPAIYTGICGTNLNKCEVHSVNVTGQTHHMATLPSHESVTLCFHLRIFSFLKTLAAVPECQQGLKVKAKN